MLYLLSDFCPHSSPDPFGATLPPGEGMDFFDELNVPGAKHRVLRDCQRSTSLRGGRSPTWQSRNFFCSDFVDFYFYLRDSHASVRTGSE